MHVKLDKYAKMPKRAHRYDAGHDLYALEAWDIPPRSYMQFSTGFHIALPSNIEAVVVGRSGMTSRGVFVPDGTIDPGYTGEIKVTLYNFNDYPVAINSGDRIAQLKFRYIIDVWFNEVEELEETERGANGFGSTGR